MLACEIGNNVSLNVLLNAGADPNIADANGDTWLHCAARNNPWVATCSDHIFSEGCSKDVLETIVNHSADVNVTNKINVTALMLACQKGNIDVVNGLLIAGANPHIHDDSGNTWLHYASYGYCSKEVLEVVINHGADVNATNGANVTTLMEASQKGNVDAIKVLLKAGADPNITDTDGNTCLHEAVYYEYPINVLLNAGANPNIATTYGYTCLHTAVQKQCCIEVLQAIINHGVDVNATSKENITAVMLACKEGNNDVINVLLNAGADPNITDGDGNTCLHYAALNDSSTDVLQAIISHGVDVNATNTNNVTALMLACHKGNRDAINVLLNAGADSNIADADGSTWLYYAARNDCTERFQEMIRLLVDVHAINKKVFTAMLVGAKIGKRDAISVLLNAGTDSNIADTDGDARPHNAAQKDCYAEVLQAITSHIVDENATQKNSVTALMKACHSGNRDAINKCLNAGVDVNAVHDNNVTAFMIACAKGNKDVINILLIAGADPNKADANGNTYLHYAERNDCYTNNLEAIISHGVDVNATHKNNVTALMIACGKGNEDAINVLLNAGADANIADANGNTCLHYAAGNDCYTKIFHVIISRGVDVNVTNESNVTALMIACVKGNKDAINVLLNAGADRNITDADGCAYLHYAVYGRCSKDVLRAIIDDGADVNARSKNSVTALMGACAKGYEGGIDVLLKAGADPNIMDDAGSTCLQYALHGSCTKHVLQTIIDHGVNINARKKNNVTALMAACATGNVDAIDVLLKAGADPDIMDDAGYTCLQYAVYESCSTEVLEAIIDHGVNVNATKKKCATALMAACQNGDVDAIDVLMKAGADPNIRDDAGDTCLHYAVEGACSIQDFQSFVDNYTDINVTNIHKQSALVLLCLMPGAGANAWIVFGVSVILKSLTDPNIGDTNRDFFAF